MTAKQLRIAARIDAAMQGLVRAGKDDMTVFTEMVAAAKHAAMNRELWTPSRAMCCSSCARFGQQV